MATSSDQDNKRRGFWLREARVRRGLSQQGVAEYLGLSSRSKSTISDWEKGVSEPKLRYIREMAALYSVPLFRAWVRANYTQVDDIAGRMVYRLGR